jgi:hypothetical protein
MNGQFDDGIVFLAKLTDAAKSGDMPKEQLTKIGRFWYDERMIGLRRQYAAKGAREQIDMIVRVHGFQKEARIGRYAILGNGDQFRITNVSRGEDDATNLRFTELTLERLDELYELSDYEGEGDPGSAAGS